jgi:hypothetical protein
MKHKLLIIMLLVCVLSISSAAFAQPNPLSAPSPAISTGGAYRLAPVTGWRINGSLSGGGYNLAVDPTSGCCCKTYLPCVIKP